MKEKSSNLYYKILNIIQNGRVNNFHLVANELGISKQVIKLAIKSLEKIGYLNLINENQIHCEESFGCKFCPFAKDCKRSERLPSIFYEISQKGKDLLKKYGR
ncbi:MAG: winged helix-turn-helix domain-containing protein [Promethearchaeia archaeon]